MWGSRLVWCAPVVLASAAGAQVAVVDGGQARAVVVVAADALPVARFAAQELIDHVAKATGVTLALAEEGKVPSQPAGRIYLGACQAAAAAGIDPGKLPVESCWLRAGGSDVYIVGHDSDGDPLGADTRAGTLWGVYELLETQLGVRWLWPGELGTEIPKTAAFQLPAMDRQLDQRLVQRQTRAGNLRRGELRRGFTEEGFRTYRRAEAVYLRRHRIGRARTLRYGHAYNDWWGKYGAEHPEWFQLLEDGKRGPAAGHGTFSMCVSDPGFQAQVVEVWRQWKAQLPGEWVNLNGCENDIRGLCTCARCLAQDGPQPEKIHPRFGPRVVSDRYARFWLAVQQLAAKEDPEATILGYAYVNYAPPPSDAIKLNEHVWVGTVPDLFFPRSEEEQEWVKQQWLGWSKTGCRLFLRPNYTLDGYCLPQIYAHQFADEFRFEAAHGMIATDFDSLTGQWAAQGPNLYLLMRLHTRPERTADELLAEYYAGFGPAGAKVKEYFDYFERYTTKTVRQMKESGMGIWARYAFTAHKVFPETVLDEGGKILDQAAAAAREPRHKERVEWLKLGLEHARMAVRAAAQLNPDERGFTPTAAKRALNDLAAFRKRTEGSLISNYDFCNYIEGRSWGEPEGYGGEPLVAVADQPAPLPTGAKLSLRNRMTCVVLLKKGEKLSATLGSQKIGNRPDPPVWSLFDPKDNRVAGGAIEFGKIAEVEHVAEVDGVHQLVIDTRGNAVPTVLRNDHAVVMNSRLTLIGPSSPVYFWVPAGTKSFTLRLNTSSPGETAVFRLLDPTGKVAFEGDTTATSDLKPTIKVGPGLDGKAWSIVYEKAQTGVLEDVLIELGGGLPSIYALAPDRLLRPAP